MKNNAKDNKKNEAFFFGEEINIADEGKVNVQLVDQQVEIQNNNPRNTDGPRKSQNGIS